MFGHSPATRLHAIRTGSWLAPEARISRLRRYAVAIGVIALGLSMIPLAAMAARKARTMLAPYGTYSRPPPPRSIPYPRLEWPLVVSGGQYSPLAWNEIAGWAADD